MPTLDNIAHRQVELPYLGIDKDRSLQFLRRFTTFRALNVVGRDTLEDRGRIGSRPGLAEAFEEQIGNGEPVYNLHVLTIEGEARSEDWCDPFDTSTFNSVWTADTSGNDAGGHATNGAPVIDAGQVYAASGTSRGLTGAISGLSDFTNYTLKLSVSPNGGTYTNAHYQITARMSDTSPDWDQEGIRGYISINGSSYSAGLESYTGGTRNVNSTTSGSVTASDPALISLQIIGNTAKLFLNSSEIISAAVDTHTGRGFGFACTAYDPYA